MALLRNRVVVAGRGGDDTDAVVAALDRRDGGQLWLEPFDDGGVERIADMATWRNSVFVVGNSEVPFGRRPRGSFVHAYALADGSMRWSASDELAGTTDFLRRATIAARRLFVVGTANDAILVRAYDARNGTALWEDNASPDFFAFERATQVTATAERVYVAGDRDTVLGRSAPYVVRAYDARTGERLWENTFGSQINSANGLALIDNTLVVAGDLYEIGLGLSRMEVRGLDPASGEVRWLDTPYSSFDAGSTTTALVHINGNVVIAGSVFRARSLPVLRSYDADTGTLRWVGADGPLQRGGIAALAVADGTIVATGTAARRARDDGGLLLRGYDDSGRIDWGGIANLGIGEAIGLAVATSGRHLAVAGSVERPAGDRNWVISAYRR